MVLWARGRALRYRLEAYGTGAGTRYRLKTRNPKLKTQNSKLKNL